MPDTVSEAALKQTCELIRTVGISAESAPAGAFAADFNNAILGSPYLEGTGWLPDRETAEGVAAFIIPLLNGIAAEMLTEHPSEDFGWVHPANEAQSSYATIISAARKDDSDDGDPVVEESFSGDAWFVASVELGLLSPNQMQLLTKVKAALGHG